LKQVGIVGLPGAGKTTVFEILMQGAAVAPGSREHVGVVRVPDPRVDRLSRLFQPKKTTYTQIQFVDSAGAAPGRARGADPFASVRNCDLLMAVVRDFEPPGLDQAADPDRDLRTVIADLILNDLGIAENRMERIAKELRVGKKQGEREHALLARCHQALEAERSLREETFDAEELKILKGFQMLSLKPLLAVYNRGEGGGHEPAPPPGVAAVLLPAHLEREIVSLPADDRPAFRAELGIEEDGLTLLIRACYEQLGLISFFTVGPDEVRAWTLREGEKAVDAAGEIHSDLARGFIRAEVIGWERLVALGGTPAARASGELRLEGREYRVHDGDCMEIRFNA
jgi:hypothetical protein